MSSGQSPSLRAVCIELAWLLGSWAFSWLILSQLLGASYLWQKQLDIQLHNTFLLFQPLLLTTLVFLPVATVVTGVRVLANAFQRFWLNAVLVAFAAIWSLTLLLAVAGWVLR